MDGDMCFIQAKLRGRKPKKDGVYASGLRDVVCVTSEAGSAYWAQPRFAVVLRGNMRNMLPAV